MRMKTVIITGVSSGLGRATAVEFARAGYQVFGSVRRRKDAESLQLDLGGSFQPLVFDVTDEHGARAAARHVADAVGSRGIAGLINNAGVVEAGPLMHIPVERFRSQIDVNLTGQLIATQAFLPLLGAQLPRKANPGRIINISSLAGRIAHPFLGAYAASKHALEGLSDALRRELMIYGIDVVLISPGTIQTSIWDKVEVMDLSPYAGSDYRESLADFQTRFVASGRKGWPAVRVAQTIRRALEARRPKARYFMPTRPIVSWLLPRALPDRWLDRILARQFPRV
jgi:NAD(P)-dependent dehydrogenase (short-subunit alcohol dehydrogenase family)